MQKQKLVVNGIPHTLVVDPEMSLAVVLREQLGLTGTKIGCGTGQCGACTVILDGRLVRSCIIKMGRVADGASVITVEGVGTPDCMHAVQLAFVAHGVAQCGFCTPGFVVSAKALLDQNTSPTRKQVRDWFQRNRNVCRCNGYKPYVDAVMDAARLLRGEITA